MIMLYGTMIQHLEEEKQSVQVNIPCKLNNFERIFKGKQYQESFSRFTVKILYIFTQSIGKKDKHY